MPLLMCCAAFGWESYKKGDWYKVVQSKAADFKVRALACKIPLFCVGQPASADPVHQRCAPCRLQALHTSGCRHPLHHRCRLRATCR